MKFSNLAATAVGAAICALICGCGDTFRPVATPLPQASPVPQTARFATFTSCAFSKTLNGGQGDCDPAGAPGTSTDIDVSGDSVAGVTTVGVSPVNALVGSSVVITADRDSGTITSYLRSSALAFGAPITTGLPSGSTPVALVNANGTTYVAESGRNVVGVLGGSPLSLSAEVPVGTHPVALAVLPNGKKIYVANQADNTVTVIDTSDNSVVTTVGVGSSPISVVPSADSSHVYVVNQGSSNVSVIDATNDQVIATLAVGSGPNSAVFDTQNQRVIVTNPGSGSISVINADPTSPQFKTVSGPIAVGINPLSVTALADGSRLYVANTGSNSVSVINSLSLTVTKTIPIPSLVQGVVNTSPISIASDQESTKVFTANRDSHDVSIINTATDTELKDGSGNIVRIQAPACPAGSNCQQLNPIFISVGPG